MSLTKQDIQSQIMSFTHKQLVKLAQTGGLKLGDYMKIPRDKLRITIAVWADQFDPETVEAWIKLAFPQGIFKGRKGWRGYHGGHGKQTQAIGTGQGESSQQKGQGEATQGQQEASESGEGKSDKPGDSSRDGLTEEEKRLLDMVADMVAKRQDKEKAAKRALSQTPEGKPRHRAFAETRAALAAGLNVLLVGPAGSGKTHLGEQVAESLGMRFGFTGAVGSEYKLLGFRNAQGEIVRTVYRDWYENGGLFMADEIDGSSPNALLCMNAGLANGHQDFPDTIVPRHEKFRMLASANTYGNGADRQYVGRNQLDAASLDRFYVIPMDYDPALEAALYGLPKPAETEKAQSPCTMTAEEWAAFVQSARKAVASFGGAIRHIVSMRAIQSGIAMLDSGISREAIERGALWKHLSAADIAKIKSAMR